MLDAAAQLFVRPVDRWDAAAAETLSGRDEVVYRSHMVGGDPALTREGGGNASAKGTVLDHRGLPTRVLWMSAWGCDCATTTGDDFPALRLDDLLELRRGGPLSESEMVDYLADCGLRGEQRRPGIETLTHAFIPATHVDHCHPDAVIALTSFPDGRARADEEFGDEAIWFDYRQFDVDVARELADRITASPRCRFVLLANHGLFTWAEDSEECYHNTLEAVARCTAALDRAIRRPADLGGRAIQPLPEHAATDVLTEVLPVLRGALSAENPATVLHVDRSPAAVEFASSVRGPGLSQRGPGCPDHVVTVGYRPLVLDPIQAPDRAAAPAVLDGVRRHRRWYEDYFQRHIAADRPDTKRRDRSPHVVVLPGVGVVSAGVDAAKARLCADHFGQTMTVIRAADAAGEYVSLTEAQGASDEYWPLMRLKPQLKTTQGPLAGQVVLVVDDGTGDAMAVAETLVAAEAHVLVACVEQGLVAELAASHGEGRVIAVPGSSNPAELVRQAVLVHGGFDVLVDLTRAAGVVSAALPVFGRQARGGLVVLVRPDLTDEDVRAVRQLASRHTGTDVIVSAVAGPPSASGDATAFIAASRSAQAAVLINYDEEGSADEFAQ